MGFLDHLARQLARNPTGTCRLELRMLYDACGCDTRTPDSTARVRAELGRHGLRAEFDARHPPSLDDVVVVTCTGRGLPGLSPAAASPRDEARGRVSPATGPTLADAAETALVSTLEVVDDGRVIGAAFIVDEAGLLLTARHVLVEDGLVRQAVTLRDADGFELRAMVCDSHRRLDYALLWIHEPGYAKALALGNPLDLRHADTVLAVGHPLGMSFTVSQGIVSNPRALVAGVEYIQTDTAIDPGNSGGPLVNAAGQVVGINLFGRSFAGAGKFALPVDYVMPALTEALALGPDPQADDVWCRLCGRAVRGGGWYCPSCGAQAFLERRCTWADVKEG